MSRMNVTRLDEALLDELSLKERMKPSIRSGRIRRNRSDYNRKR